jgi:hypothetical protein
MSRLHRIGRAVRGPGTFVICFGTVAATALGATLSVRVTPTSIHKGDDYRIAITGKFRQRELTGKAYLIPMIQYSASPCRRTAQLENDNEPVQFYLRTKASSQRVGIFETKSPFTRIDAFTAASQSTRRVCVYLYPKYVTAGASTAPIAMASAKYTVLKK